MLKPLLQCVLVLTIFGFGQTQALAPHVHSLTFQQMAAQADAARDSNHLDQAQALYRQALAAKPSWAEGWWSLGTILYDLDHYAPAARAFTRLVALDPENGTAHLMLGLCQYQLRSYPASLKNIQAAENFGIRKDDALLHVLHYHKAMLLLRNGRYEDAVDPLKLLVEQGVHSEELDLALGMSSLLIAPQVLPDDAQKRKVIAAVGQAESLHLAKKNDEALQRYTELTKEFPKYPNLHYAFGHYLLRVDDADQAVAQFQQEIQNNPKHVRAYMQIAAARYRTDSAAGIPYVQKVIQLQPSYPFAHHLLGLLYADTGDTAKALPELEKAARMVPGEAQFQFALGNAYAKAGRKEDAARARAAFFRLSKKAAGADTPASNTYGDKPNLKLDSATPSPDGAERQRR